MRWNTFFVWAAALAGLILNGAVSKAEDLAQPADFRLTRTATIDHKVEWSISRLVMDPDGRYILPLSPTLNPYAAPVIETATGRAIGSLTIDTDAIHAEPVALLSDPCRIVATEWKPGFETSAVALDCRTGQIVRRFARPDGQPLIATEAVSATCGLLLAKLRGPTEPEKRDLGDQEYTVFDLATGAVDEARTKLFAKGDQGVSLTQSGPCKAYVMRYSAHEAALSLRSAFVEAAMIRVPELWEIDIAAGTSRQVARLPGSPTTDAILSEKAPPVISRNGRIVGIPAQRMEAAYEVDGRLKDIRQYDRIELVDVQSNAALTPLRCLLDGVSTAGAFLAGNDYAVLVGCRKMRAARMGTQDGFEIDIGPLRNEDDAVTAFAFSQSANLLALAIDLHPLTSGLPDDENEIRLYTLTTP